MKTVSNLSLTEKVGQMFLVGLDGYTADERVMELIQTYKVGGFVIYENNVKSAEQLLRLTNSLKAMNAGNEIPLIIAISQEGGRTSVIPSEIRKIPAIKYIAEKGDKNLVYETAAVVGKIIKAFGFNMNFWPLLDLGGSVDGRLLADRCISSNPTIVSSYSDYIVKGLNEQGIVSIPKYFPGYNTTKNKGSNLVIPSTSKSIQKLEQSDMVPFKSMVARNVEGIMVGHINMARLNLFAPATMSHKVITKLLKEKYEYNGLVISDDLTKPSVDIQYGIKGSTRRAVVAGCDLMIINDIRKVKTALESITKEINKQNISSQEIDKRVQKILDMKQKFNLKDEEIFEIDIKSLNEEIENLIEKIRAY